MMNHLNFNFKLSENAEGKFRITGFEVEPLSLSDFDNHEVMYELRAGKEIPFYYSMTSSIENWSHRSDHFASIKSHFNKVMHR